MKKFADSIYQNFPHLIFAKTNKIKGRPFSLICFGLYNQVCLLSIPKTQSLNPFMDNGERELLILKNYDKNSKHSSCTDIGMVTPTNQTPLMPAMNEEESKEQPASHEMNKSFGEKIFGVCCSGYNYDLDQEELSSFYKLKRISNENYEKDNTIHVNLLKRLYELLFHDKCDSLLSKRWIEVGFQNKDITKDLRSAGMIAIRNLVFICETCREDVQLMCLEESDFLFGITSINITFFIKKYFHLIHGISLKSNKPQICSRKTLKNFARIITNERATEIEIYNKIYVFLMRRVFLIWKRMKKINPDILLIHFDAAILTLKRETEVCFKRGDFRDLQSFFQAYKNIVNKPV